MVKWSRWESNPRPLECHAEAGVHGRCATVRNRARNQALAGVQMARRARSRTVRPAHYPHTRPRHSFGGTTVKIARGPDLGPRDLVCGALACASSEPVDSRDQTSPGPRTNGRDGPRQPLTGRCETPDGDGSRHPSHRATASPGEGGGSPVQRPTSSVPSPFPRLCRLRPRS